MSSRLLTASVVLWLVSAVLVSSITVVGLALSLRGVAP
jgi:hypothetical protein